MNLEALFNAVIVKPIEQNEEMYGSIVVPDIGKDRNEHAVVVAIGPGQHTHMGHFIESYLKVGDEVVLPTQGFTKMSHMCVSTSPKHTPVSYTHLTLPTKA